MNDQVNPVFKEILDDIANPIKYADGTEREVVDCPSCKRQRWIDANCHHCGNSAISCLKFYLKKERDFIQSLSL